MVRLVAIVMFASGCFYTDSIHERPSLDIEQVVTGPAVRGGTIKVVAITDDPQHTAVFLAWNAYACSDDCDAQPFLPGANEEFDVHVPALRADHTPVTSVRITLDGTDELGVAARPTQQLVVAVGDAPPDLHLRAASTYPLVPGVPIELFATVGDADDGPTAPTVAWQVFAPPGQPGYTLVDTTVAQNPVDPDHHQSAKIFTAAGTGDWMFQVTATDPLGVATPQPLDVIVAADRAPCLAQWTPIAPSQPSDVLALTDPTLFQVLVVDDDLDPYPTIAGDPVYGSEAFTWSILPPGATTRQTLDTTSNQVELDPAAYAQGDIVELRVEIADRNATPITCADGDLTCSTISVPTCIQRLTWRVEVQ